MPAFALAFSGTRRLNFFPLVASTWSLPAGPTTQRPGLLDQLGEATSFGGLGCRDEHLLRDGGGLWRRSDRGARDGQSGRRGIREGIGKSATRGGGRHRSAAERRRRRVEAGQKEP